MQSSVLSVHNLRLFKCPHAKRLTINVYLMASVLLGIGLLLMFIAYVCISTHICVPMCVYAYMCICTIAVFCAVQFYRVLCRPHLILPTVSEEG